MSHSSLNSLTRNLPWLQLRHKQNLSPCITVGSVESLSHIFLAYADTYVPMVETEKVEAVAVAPISMPTITKRTQAFLIRLRMGSLITETRIRSPIQTQHHRPAQKAQKGPTAAQIVERASRKGAISFNTESSTLEHVPMPVASVSGLSTAANPSQDTRRSTRKSRSAVQHVDAALGKALLFSIMRLLEPVANQDALEAVMVGALSIQRMESPGVVENITADQLEMVQE